MIAPSRLGEGSEGSDFNLGARMVVGFQLEDCMISDSAGFRAAPWGTAGTGLSNSLGDVRFQHAVNLFVLLHRHAQP